jgi:cold shock CspA family protein
MTLAPQIAFRNMEAQPELEESVLKEAKKLEVFFSRITSCRVAIEAPARQGQGRVHHRIRIDLGVPGEELVVEHNATPHPDQEKSNRKQRDAGIAIREAFREMRRRVQDYTQRMRPVVDDRPGPLEGKVTKILIDQGFGFIEGDGHGIYFHRNSVVGGQFESLRIGSRVRFTEEEGDKGPQASTVRLVRASRQRKSAAAVALISRSA